jgi:hypothetical protein
LGRKATAVAAGVVLAGGSLAGATVRPVPATAATTVQHIAGNFVGDARDEVFEYRPGAGADFMFVDFRVNSSNRPDFQQISYTIPGTPVVFAGDFDGDGHDELFLYGAGTAPDAIWDFVDDTTVQSHPVRVDGLFFAVPGDFDSDGDDDVLWYAPGQVADEIWELRPGFQHTTHPIDITGDYVPLRGRFTGDGADDVVLYGRGTTPDHLFDFRPDGGFVPVRVLRFEDITGENHQPFTLDRTGDGRTDIFFYNPGTAGDPYWDFTPDRGTVKSTETVNGTYVPAAGDFFGDGCDDVFWFGTSSSSIWNWFVGGDGVLHKSQYAFGT